jgi:hypothetical protein
MGNSFNAHYSCDQHMSVSLLQETQTLENPVFLSSISKLQYFLEIIFPLLG